MVELNSNFTEIRSIKNLDISNHYKYFCDINRDGNKEIIFHNRGNRINIIDESLRNRCKLTLPQIEKIRNLMIWEDNRTGKQLFVTSDQALFYLIYQKNPLYAFRFLLYLSVFASVFLFLFGAHGVYRWRLFASKLVKYAVTNSDRGIARLDTRGRIRAINSAFEKLALPDRQLEKNEHHTSVFRDTPLLLNFIRHVQRSGKPQEKSVEMDSGLQFNGKLIGTPVCGLWGIPYAYLIELHDYSQPIRDDRIKSWSKTVQKMAHDIKTPLSSISLYLQTLQYKITDMHPDMLNAVGNDLTMIQQELHRITNMSKNFMKFVNLEKPNIQTIRLKEIVDRIAERFRDFFDGSIRLQTEIDADAERVWADPEQLEMCLTILIENSLDAVDGEGIIQVQAQLAQYLEKHFQDYIHIDVSNTGKGIPPDVAEKIFEPYFTTKQQGTGMGLAIAKKIVEDHGGKIEVSSRVHFATTFRIILPMYNVSC